MAGVAGSSIANAVGRPDSGGTPWTSTPIIFPIGNYVESPVETQDAADCNYIGLNNHYKATTNTLGEGSIATGPTVAPQPDFTCYDNDNDARGGTSQWVRAVGTIAENGTCTITAGAATAGAGTYSCYVPGGVVAGDFFWATTMAD